MYVCELTKRKSRGKQPREIRGPDDVVAIMGVRFRKAQREHFVVLLFNARHEVRSIETVSVGSLNASIVHPREVFKPAIVHSASAIALAHNHPSGDVTPSEEDLQITRRLKEAGHLLGIDLLDHVIVGKNAYTSLKERKLL